MASHRKDQLFQPSCARDKRFAYFSRSHYLCIPCAARDNGCASCSRSLVWMRKTKNLYVLWKDTNLILLVCILLAKPLSLYPLRVSFARDNGWKKGSFLCEAKLRILLAKPKFYCVKPSCAPHNLRLLVWMRKTKDTRIYRCCEKIPTFAASIPCAARLRKRLFFMRSHYPFFAYFSRSHYLLFECVKPRIYTCFAQPSPSCFAKEKREGYTPLEKIRCRGFAHLKLLLSLLKRDTRDT